MHGRSGALDADEPLSEMNFIPLIDIALTLVIILMVTTAFVRQPGVSLKLPETATREGKPETPKDLTIAIASDGRYFVDGKNLSVAELRGRLVTFGARNKDLRVLVKGDRAVPYANVMEVMDLVRQAGLTKIVLPTDPRPTTMKGG